MVLRRRPSPQAVRRRVGRRSSARRRPTRTRSTSKPSTAQRCARAASRRGPAAGSGSARATRGGARRRPTGSRPSSATASRPASARRSRTAAARRRARAPTPTDALCRSAGRTSGRPLDSADDCACPPGPHRRGSPRRLPRRRGLRVGLLGARRGDDGHPRRAVAERDRPTRHDASRAGRGVHGRRPRAPHRSSGRRDGHARPGRDEPRHRHRRRVPRPRPDGRDHRPGVLGQAPQGGPPGRRHRPDAGAGHEVEHARGAGRGDPRDRPQGVPRRDPREAGPDPHRAAREPGRLAARGRRRDRTNPAEQGLLPGADR